jgi:hypothetical protein
MKHYSIIGAPILIFVSLFAGTTSRAGAQCDCPKDDPATHGAYHVLIDKELSSSERMPTAGPMGFAKTMTVCMFFDPTNKGYPVDLKLVVEGSIDGRTWFPAMLAGRETQAAVANGCVQVTPTRFVRVGWPPAANIVAPGPRVTAQVQVSY